MDPEYIFRINAPLGLAFRKVGDMIIKELQRGNATLTRRTVVLLEVPQVNPLKGTNQMNSIIRDLQVNSIDGFFFMKLN